MNDKNELDAARYRWMKSNALADIYHASPYTQKKVFAFEFDKYYPDKINLDEAIDEAIANDKDK